MLLVESAKNLHCAGDVIAFAVDQGWTTPAQLCEIMRISDSTLSRWRNGESEPGFDQITRVVQHPATNPQLRLLFLNVMAATTSIFVIETDVDVAPAKEQDVLSTLVEAITKLSSEAKRFLATSLKTWSPGQVMDLRAKMADVCRLAAGAVRLAEKDALSGMRVKGGRR